LIQGAQLPTGWATLATAVFFLGGIQLLGIGLLGEYLARVYNEVKRRPEFMVLEHSFPTSGHAVGEVHEDGRGIGGTPGI
jgi:polyisoprenyl-phosphate glycosyltransferase